MHKTDRLIVAGDMFVRVPGIRPKIVRIQEDSVVFRIRGHQEVSLGAESVVGIKDHTLCLEAMSEAEALKGQIDRLQMSMNQWKEIS